SGGKKLAPQAGPAAPPDQRPQGNQAVSRLRAPVVRRHVDAVPARHVLRYRRGNRTPPDAGEVFAAQTRTVDCDLSSAGGVRGASGALEAAVGVLEETAA